MTEDYIELVTLLSNIVSAVIAIQYIHEGFEKKKNGLSRYLLFSGGCLVYFALLVYLTHTNEFEGIAGVLYILAVLLYAVIALKGRFLEKVTFSIFWGLIALISSYLIYGLAGILTDQSLSILFAKKGYMKLYFIIAATVVKFLLARVVLLIKKRKTEGSDSVEEWIVAGTFFMVFLLVIGIFGMESSFIKQKTRTLLSLSVLRCVCCILLILGYLHSRLEEQRRQRLKAEFLLEMKETKETNMKNIWKKDLELRKIRHDIRGSMDVLHRLIQSEKLEEALGYIESMNEKIHSQPPLTQDTGNEGINSALIRMIQDCHEKRIPFQYLIGGHLKELDAMDMGLLFFNLFSNAIEAAELADSDREIDLEIAEQGGWIYCRLCNSICHTATNQNPHFSTTKKDKELHGFGMLSIREIIQKYHGEYTYFQENKTLIQNILLKKPIPPISAP